MDTIVVIPTYNESENIGRLISHILYLYPDFIIVIIDSNSSDNTRLIVNNLSKKFINKIILLQEENKNGLAHAYVTAYEYILNNFTQCEKIIQMDADFSHNPRYIKDLVAAIDNKDFSIGSRYIYGGKIINWNMIRRIISYLANLYVIFWLGFKIKDCTGGFRCFRRNVLASINIATITSDGFLFQTEMLERCLGLGYSFSEIPIAFAERTNGKSKFNFKEMIEVIIGVPKLWFSRYIDIFNIS